MDPTEQHCGDVGILVKYKDNNNNNNKVYNVVLGIIVISVNICTTNAEMGNSCHPLNHQMI